MFTYLKKMENTKVGKITNTKFCWALVAQACHPSYSGGRDQEDRGWKPARENSS
jgi:hypothetical protein